MLPDGNSYYDSYIINFRVDALTAMCEVLTSADDDDDGREWKVHRFPITKRYDRSALTDLLLAASMQYNSDYVSIDHVRNLVKNAYDSIWSDLRHYGARRLPRPRMKKEEAIVTA